MRIAIIAGGAAEEHEVSLDSARTMQQALDGHDVLMVTINQRLDKWQVGDQDMKPTQALAELSKRVDVCLLALHGSFGEDGTVQGALQTAGLPYTGSELAASSLAFDKFGAGLMFGAIGLNSPLTMLVDRRNPLPKLKFDAPYIIKPRRSGSSRGVVVCKDKPALQQAVASSEHLQLVVQPQVEGRELTCGVYDRSDGSTMILPITEVTHNGKVLDYDAKYHDDDVKRQTPAKLNEAQTQQVQSAALKAHRALGCRGISRSDFILSEDKLYILEINTCPGMSDHSFIPLQLATAQLELGEVLLDLCKASLRG